MIKFIHKFLVVLSFITAGVANAGLITTDLTEDNYVTIGELDWAWASSVNVSEWNGNILKAPTLHEGWRYAKPEELTLFILNRDITLFQYTDKDENVAYKHALSFWNTKIERLVIKSGFGSSSTDIDNFNNGHINSKVVADNNNKWYYETFYVRNTQVPEPSTIMIFAIALIALSMRKRTAK